MHQARTGPVALMANETDTLVGWCCVFVMFVPCAGSCLFFGISKSTHTVRVAIINLTYNLMHILSTATVVDK